MVDLTIRPATCQDVEAICMVHQSAVNSLESGPYDRDVLDMWSKVLTPQFICMGMNKGEITIFVAEIYGKIVGFAGFYKDSVRALYVHSDHRGKGIGERLLRHIEAQIVSEGFLKIRLESSLNSRSFYESQGYRVIGEERFVLSKKVSMASLMMEKYI